MKVLHLPIILCDQPSEMVLSLNRAGIKADYAVLDTNGQEWLLTENNIKYNLHTTDLVKNDPDIRAIRKTLYKFFLQAIQDYDIFHFHSNISHFSPWLGHFKDLEILKKAGKKIVVSYWGCDIRTKRGNSKYKYNSCVSCKAACDDKKKLISRDIFAKYADLTIAHMPELYEYAPYGSKHLPSLINTNYWRSSNQPKPNPEVFKIFHPFGNSQARGDVRGTEDIKKAVEILKQEGFNIEFLFFDKVPHGQMKDHYEQSDLVIEQLKYGTYGLTALEAMALEIPVMGYIRDKYKKYYHNNIPMIEANPDTITDVLRKTVQNREYLRGIGKEGRQFVLKYHDSNKIAQQLINRYEEILKKKSKGMPELDQIARDIRKAIGFKTLMMSTNDETETQDIELAEELNRAGFTSSLAKYRTLQGPALAEVHEKNSQYEIYRFYENQASKSIKIGPLGIFRFFDKLRHLALMNYRLLRYGLNVRPDIIHARGSKTLVAGLLIKNKVGSSLIYEKDKNESSDIKLPIVVQFVFYCLEKIFANNIDILVLPSKTNYKKEIAKNFVKIYHEVLLK